MTDMIDFEARLSNALAAYADRAPVEVDPISLTAVIAHDGAKRRWSPPRSRAAWVLVAVLLTLVIVGAAVVGSRLLTPKPTLGGGGPMVIGQLGLANPGFGGATGMHVFAFDPATGIQVPIADLPMATDSGYSPATFAKWAPDGQHVLVFGPDGNPAGVVDAATGALSPLVEPAGMSFANGDYQMSWAPDSQRIAAIVATGSGLDRILFLDLSGRDVGSVALPPRTGLTEPTWSPDGSAILLSGCMPCILSEGKGQSYYVPTDHLFIVPVDGSETRVLLDPPVSLISYARWSPDGRQIVFSTPAGLETIVVADGRRTVLTHDHDSLAAWSPDGRNIAFIRWIDNDPDGRTGGTLNVIDVDGTHLKRLTQGFDESPKWSPDGAWLVFDREGEMGARDVWVVSSSGGAPRFLLKSATADW